MFHQRFKICRVKNDRINMIIWHNCNSKINLSVLFVVRINFNFKV